MSIIEHQYDHSLDSLQHSVSTIAADHNPNDMSIEPTQQEYLAQST
jgi:hypothetical protein